MFSCVLFIGVGFGYMMGWFPILIDIIVLLCGGVGGIILLAIMKNNKMERKNPIASNYLDRKETSLPFGELKT